MTAPNFCMLLRKHIANGRIISVTQPGLERIVRIESSISMRWAISEKIHRDRAHGKTQQHHLLR